MTRPIVADLSFLIMGLVWNSARECCVCPTTIPDHVVDRVVIGLWQGRLYKDL